MSTGLGPTQVFADLPAALDSIPADELDGLLYEIVRNIEDDFPIGRGGRMYAKRLAEQWGRYLGGDDKRDITIKLIDHFEGFPGVEQIKDALLKSCAYK